MTTIITNKTLINQLLKLSLPLIPKYGFNTTTISLASLSLPNQSIPYSTTTIQALFPSSPLKPKNHSLSREELTQEAKNQVNGVELNEEERRGPQIALFEAWLEEGRNQMMKSVEMNKGGVKDAIKERIVYNQNLLKELPEAIELLREDSIINSVVPIYSSPAYLAHLNSIANDACYAIRHDGQGTDWYKVRAQLAVIYGLAESHLLSPKYSNLPSEERIASTLDLVDTLFEQSNFVSEKLTDASNFGEFIFRSWRGLGRSLGL